MFKYWYPERPELPPELREEEGSMGLDVVARLTDFTVEELRALGDEGPRPPQAE